MKCINLINTFDREIEVLEMTDKSMVYAIDQKNEVMDACYIGKYDFESGENHQLILLDYTRLYESFQTYKQNEDYFYAINVLQDYRLRLRRINKKTWSLEGELTVDALGEILSIYIIDEQYLLIVDEVKKTDEFLKMFKLKDNDSEYINLCYLYDCYSYQRYPMTDDRLQSFIDTVIIYDDVMVIAVHERGDMEDEAYRYKNEHQKSDSAVYKIDRQAFITSVTEKMPLFLEEIYASDEHSAVRFFENDNDDIVCRIRDFDADTEQLLLYDVDTEQQKVVFEYPYSGNGTYFYDLWNYHVYYEEDYSVEDMAEEDAQEAESIKHVTCVTDSKRSFNYSDRYGEFSGIYRDDVFVTTFYKEIMMKEYEYHEYVAVHESGDEEEPLSCEGRFAAYKDKVVLLKTFLAL